ncbi:NB-ARC domain-containing protein [Nostoc sp.]|uniref:NB-ARC domain-containing protein n=1 Tax=Nostoc sp. TaxID=1180 RepID=UPI002FFCEC23
MHKRNLRRLWKQIILFLSKLAGFLRGNRRRLKRRRHLLLKDEVAQTRLDRHIQSQVEQPVLGNAENDEASVTSLEPHIQSQVEQTISGNENVFQDSKGDKNINVGRVEGSLTINYSRPIGIPFQAPSLPANFVHRPQVTIEIKARLLANTSNAGALLISAIHGLGGIGKTTLVTALAHDEDIQKCFSGGVLWATLGQEPDILALLSSWVQALGDYEFLAINIEATSAYLRSLLHDKAVLLVVDDAWEPDKVKPFLVASSQSRLLITSRRADVAGAVGADLQQLNLMTPAESLKLFSKSLGREIKPEEKQEALRVAETLGYLPIALNLVAARVKWGITWVKLETALKQEVANLKVLYGARQENSLEATFNLSLKALQDYDEQAWKNFIWLGVLPEDVTIAAPMAVTLWDMESQDEADERLELLWSDALLLPDSPIFVGGVEWKGYRIHDLLHDVARDRLINPATGMSLNLLDAHSRLLERYRQKTQKNLWHTLPNDDYIHQNLVWHLEKAQRIEEIHSLLREESQTGSNGWFEAREKLGQAGGYITDISRAWELAQANWTESTLPQVVGLQCRYALISASLNSLAANIPVNLLLALVKNNKLTPEQGLAYALQNPKPQEKINSLTQLVNYLPPNLQELALQKALAAATAIQDEWSRAYALSALAFGFSQMPAAELFPPWQDTLHKLSLHTRSDLLQDIKALFPVIFALGGETATAEIARAIVDVARWWK